MSGRRLWVLAVALMLGAVAPAHAAVTIHVDAAGDWPKFHHDLSNTGYSTSTAPNVNRVLWSYTTGGGVRSSPAVADGKLYVGSDDHKVYCLDAATGDWQWEYETGDQVRSSPAVADGKVYVGSYDHKVYCLDAATGAWQWEYSTGWTVYSSPAVADGNVYVGSDDGKVYCLDAATGAWQWEWDMGYYAVKSSPAVADGKVYVGSNDHYVYCLDAATGAWQWGYYTPGYVESSPAVADGKVYVGSGDHVYCLDAATGAWQWEYRINMAVDSSPAVAGGKVYVSSFNGYVYCLDAASGARQWEYPCGWAVYSSPAVADGKVYVGSDDGKVYCLDAATGAWQWEYETGGWVYSSPAVADGKVYVGSDDGTVYCFADYTTELPTADFEWDPAGPSTLATVQFTDLSSDPDGTVVAWSWDFGDGGTSAAQHPTHDYTSGGCMEVTLTVTDSEGAPGTCSKCVPIGSDTELPFCDAGWHMVGRPRSNDHELSNITVRDDTGTYPAATFCNAAGLGWIQNPLFYYETAGQEYLLCGCEWLTPPTTEHTMRMGYGYWLYTFEPYLTLVFPW